MSQTRISVSFWASLLVYAAAVLPRMVAPDSQFYTSILTPAVVDSVGSIIRLGALVVAWWFISSAARRFDADNPASTGWTLLKWGMTFYVLGQLTLNVMGRVLAEVPYPSVADALFLIGTVLLTAALVSFLRSYLAGGLMGSASGPLTVGAVAAVIVAVVDVLALRPLVDSEVPVMETVVNLGYPILDSLLVVAAIMLFRITVRFGSGAIGKVWALLLSGFICMGVGDILYAYFTAFDMALLEPVMDVMYTWSYFLLAFGAVVNFRLTKAE